MDHRRLRALTVVAASALLLGGVVVLYLRPAPSPQPMFTKLAAAPPTHTTADETVTFDFLTPTLGWAAATSSRISTTATWVYGTTDGARSWHLRCRFDRRADDGAVDQLRFFDPVHALIELGSGPIVAYRTDDGGGSWRRLVLPPDTWFLDFTDPRHGWATSPFADPSGAMQAYSTADGGATWRPLPDLPLPGLLAFRSPSEGWLGGQPASNSVYKSVDGGFSWQPISLRSGLAGERTAGPLPGSADVITVLQPHGVVVFDQSTGVVTASTDSGATWHAVSSPSGYVDFALLRFGDATHWWLIVNQELYKTTDAGSTWADVAHVIYGHIVPTIIDSQHAWAMMQTTDDTISGRQSVPVWELDFTSDGGAHWSARTVPVPG